MLDEISSRASGRQGKLLNFIPKGFKGLFRAITSDARDLHEFWKITRLVCGKYHGLGRELTAQAYETAFLEFYESCKAASKGKFDMRNPFGFYYKVINSNAGGVLRRSKAADAFQAATSWIEG